MATWLYHQTEEPRIFETKDDVDAALAEGWADSPTAFVPDEDSNAPDMDELRAQANALGIAVGPRWGEKRLKQAIEDAQPKT